MQPEDQSHTDLMRVMTHYQPTGEVTSTTKREGPQLEGGNPKRGRGRRTTRPAAAAGDENVTNLTNMFGRDEAATRGRAQLHAARNGAEMELMVFMQNGEGSVLRSLTLISEEWHKQAGKPQGSQLATRGPLRVVMAQCFFKELEARSAKVPSTEGGPIEAGASEATGAVGGWSVLATAPMVPSPCLCSRLTTSSERCRRYSRPRSGILLRFHALKPLHKTQARDGSAVVPWKLVIGHWEAKAPVLWQHLQRCLCHHAVTQLVLTRIRQATIKRSHLAQKISQILD